MTNASAMFDSCISLPSFTGDLSSITEGDMMFRFCDTLTSFSGDLSSLSTAYAMFEGDENFTSFDGNLSSLTDGEDMFHDCKLDLDSVNRIAESLPTYTSGTHKITISVDKSLVTQAQQNAANVIIVGKGWTPTWQRK